MDSQILILIATAASLGFFHTLLGPDHYLPFIVMSKARNWSNLKTAWITTLCGLGHVGSSVLLGGAGVLFGVGLQKLEIIDTFRGDWAAWGFLLFGLAYLLWAIWKLKKNVPHGHYHAHDNTVHSHHHDHDHPFVKVEQTPHEHSHEHRSKNITPWILFLIFVLGPCEPLIPVLLYPAVQASTLGVIAVIGTFTIVTIATMLGVVFAVGSGFELIKTSKLEKYVHVIAGLTIIASGALILLGL